MSNAKFTDKAWKVVNWHNLNLVRTATSDENICTVVSNANDARLISVAPELYFALQDATCLLLDIYGQAELNSEWNEHLWGKIQQYAKTVRRARGDYESDPT